MFENLIQGCINREDKARKELYDLFSVNMYNISLRYAVNKSQAEDIYQEAFLKVFENIAQVKNEQALPGWIKTIFINTALHFNNRELKFNFKEINYSKETDSFEDTPIDYLSADEILEEIKKLPTKCRFVFNFFAIEGYSHQEIATLMGISVGTSKSQLHDARRLLQKAILKNSNHFLKLVV